MLPVQCLSYSLACILPSLGEIEDIATMSIRLRTPTTLNKDHPPSPGTRSNHRPPPASPPVTQRQDPPTNPQDLPFTILFISSLLFRILNSTLVQTYYDPDEFWQSLEIAHRSVFGYGYLTWEWTENLRGFSYPLLFACVYKGLEILGLDDTELLVCFWNVRNEVI